MVTVIKDPFLNEKTGREGSPFRVGEPGGGAQSGGREFTKLDTRIPPEAKPIMAEVSVNGIAIEEASILAEAQLHPADNPGQALMAAARALVVRELLLQQARALKLETEPETHENGTVETVEDALIRTLIEQEVETPVSNRQVRKRYYQQNKHRFKAQTIYEARHILLAVRKGEDKTAKRKQSEALIAMLSPKPEAFAEIASQVSDCPSKAEGGNLGQLVTGSTVPEFDQVLGKMKAGQIWPEPVESRFGFHVVQLVHKIPGKGLPFEQVEEKIGAWLEASSWSRAVSQYISILAGNAKISGVALERASSPLVQ